MIVLTKQDSSNKKLGNGVRATYRKVDQTCPDCKLLETETCYAMYGHVALHSKRGKADKEDGPRLYEWLKDLPEGKKVRHHVSGDLFKGREPDLEYIEHMLKAHAERPDLEGWSYTHGWRQLNPLEINEKSSLTVNASCETEEDVVDAISQGWPATMVVGPEADDFMIIRDGIAVPVIVCPAQRIEGKACSNCMLCFRGKRKAVIAFRAHGNKKDSVPVEETP